MGRFLGQSQFKYIPPGGQIVQDVTTSTTLSVNSIYFVNTTSAAITLTLPQLPAAGTFVEIVDVANKFDVNTCTVLPSGDGSNVGGFTDNLTLDLAGATIRLQYSAGGNNWLVTNIL